MLEPVRSEPKTTHVSNWERGQFQLQKRTEGGIHLKKIKIFQQPLNPQVK